MISVSACPTLNLKQEVADAAAGQLLGNMLIRSVHTCSLQVNLSVDLHPNADVLNSDCITLK